MMAARCGPKRANFDAIEKARGQSPARIAACTWESLVCTRRSCGRRLYTERARISRRDKGVFRPPRPPGKAQGALCGGSLGFKSPNGPRAPASLGVYSGVGLKIVLKN